MGCATTIKSLPLDFLGLSRVVLRKSKDAIYRLQIFALVPEIFKQVKYANEMTDDVIYSTKYYMKFINSAILVNLQQKPLKLGMLIVLNATHL